MGGADTRGLAGVYLGAGDTAVQAFLNAYPGGRRCPLRRRERAPDEGECQQRADGQQPAADQHRGAESGTERERIGVVVAADAGCGGYHGNGEQAGGAGHRVVDPGHDAGVAVGG
jgi:hypothetical protein